MTVRSSIILLVILIFNSSCNSPGNPTNIAETNTSPELETTTDPVNFRSPAICKRGEQRDVDCSSSIEGAKVANQVEICSRNRRSFTSSGDCIVSECLSTYSLTEANTCEKTVVSTLCNPGEVKNISCTDDIDYSKEAYKDQKCSRDGSSFYDLESCSASSCLTGYSLTESKTCEETPVATLCEPGEIKNVSCIDDLDYAKEAYKDQKCSPDGSSFYDLESCSASSCLTGYSLTESKTCEETSVATLCEPGEMQGEGCSDDIIYSIEAYKDQLCAQDGLSFVDSGSCSAISCVTGYSVNAEGLCEKKITSSTNFVQHINFAPAGFQNISDYVSVSGNTYETSQNYGFNLSVAAKHSVLYFSDPINLGKEGTNTQLIAQSYVYSKEARTFSIKVPNNAYKIIVYTCNSGHLDMNFKLEGIARGDYKDTSDGCRSLKPLVMHTKVTDGQLDLEVSTNNANVNWILSALRIESIDTAPNISGMVGFPSQGNLITIVGSDFGASAKFKQFIYDEFEYAGSDQTRLFDLNSDWLSRGATGSLLTSLDSYSGSKSVRNYVTPNNENDWQTNNRLIGPSDEIYFSYRYKYNIVGSFRLIKMSRITSNKDGGNHYNGLGTIALQLGQPEKGYIVFTAAESYSTIWKINGILQNKWVRIEHAMKLSTPGVKDGLVTASVDRNTRLYADNIMWRAQGDNYQIHNILLGLMALDPDASSSVDQKIDQVYVGRTQARVEICNSPVWESTTNCEVQNIKSWNNESVEFTFDRVNYPVGTKVYAFVLDHDGVPTDAYPLIVN